MLIHSEVDRKPVLDIHDECRTSAGDFYIACGDRNIELQGLLRDIRPDIVRRFSCGNREFHFLPDEIVELISIEIRRAILSGSENQTEKDQQKELLSAV